MPPSEVRRQQLVHQHEVRAQPARRAAPMPRQLQARHQLEEAGRQARRARRQGHQHAVELPSHALHLTQVEGGQPRVLREERQVRLQLARLERAGQRDAIPNEAEGELLPRREPILGDLEHKPDDVERPFLERLHLRIDLRTVRPHQHVVVHVDSHGKRQHHLGTGHLDHALEVE